MKGKNHIKNLKFKKMTVDWRARIQGHMLEDKTLTEVPFV